MYIPVAVDDLLQEKVQSGELPLKYLDQYRFIISHIVFERMTDKRYEEEGSYVRMNMDTLRRHISQDYAYRFRDALIAWKIIECNGVYSKREHTSFGYRLTDEYRGGRLMAMNVCDPLLQRNIGRMRREQEERIQQYPPGYAAVAKWLSALTIDKVKAESHITEHFHEGSDKHGARMLAVDGIAHKQFWCIVDGKAGRAHHNVSNLAGDLRPFLTIHGKPLEQIDIANSQPLFMHLLFARQGGLDPSEQARMESALLSGQFYGMLNAEQLEVEAFKESFYQFLFGDNIKRGRVAKRFTKEFPSYALQIQRAKEGDYTKFAILLQAEEANVVYEAVKRFVEKTHDNAPILSIHDSLVTTPDLINMARDALAETFMALHGVTPLLRLKKASTDIKHSSTNKRTKNMETSILTCISIESIGFANGKAGKLIRFLVKFKEGLEGEYWGKSEESKKNFPLNVPRKYDYEPLTKSFGPDTLKFYPLSKEKAQERTVTSAPAPKEGRVVAAPPVGSKADAVAAVAGSVRLVAAGKIALAEIEPTAVNLKNLITKLSEQ